MKLKFMLALLPLSIMNQVFAAPVALLPDLVTSRVHLFDRKIDTDTIPGAKLLRFSNATPNLGRGKLELRGGETTSSGSQKVYQRIYNSDGSFTQRLAGTFDFHPEHHHTHFNDYANYNLRRVVGFRGVGSIVARSSKVSFCITDSFVANPRLPGFRPIPKYTTCTGGTQGISVGWMDVYKKTLPGQWIDISHVSRGLYWLESVVDPYNRIKESNEKNNRTRVLVLID